MRQSIRQLGIEKETEILREYLLEPEERLILNSLKSFNRRASQLWQEDVFPEFNFALAK